MTITEEDLGFPVALVEWSTKYFVPSALSPDGTFAVGKSYNSDSKNGYDDWFKTDRLDWRRWGGVPYDQAWVRSGGLYRKKFWMDKNLWIRPIQFCPTRQK